MQNWLMMINQTWYVTDMEGGNSSICMILARVVIANPGCLLFCVAHIYIRCYNVFVCHWATSWFVSVPEPAAKSSLFTCVRVVV